MCCIKQQLVLHLQVDNHLNHEKGGTVLQC